MRCLLVVLCSAGLPSACQAKELVTVAATVPASSASAPTTLDRLDEGMRRAEEQAGAIKKYPEPRIVLRGAKPEVIIKGGEISFEGRPLRIGGSLEEWKRVIGKAPRCHAEERQPTRCTWDELGIQAMTPWSNDTVVSEMTIHLNPRPKDPYEGLVTHSPDGTPRKRLPDFTPKKPFQGYLELDGFGIDSKPGFWAIRAQADRRRNLDCGLRDCSHPSGLLRESVKLYLRLNRNDEYGNVFEFSISGSANSEQPASNPRP